MLDIASVVDAWDWHVAGQGVRVFFAPLPPGGPDELWRRLGEPWGHQGLVGVAPAADGSLLFGDARGPLADSASARLASQAAAAWRAGRPRPDSVEASLPPVVPTAAGADVCRVGPWIAAPAGKFGLALEWDAVDAIREAARTLLREAGADGTAALLVDPPRGRAVGVRASGELWRGAADVAPAAAAFAAAIGSWVGIWRSLTNLPVEVARVGADHARAAVRVRPHLVAMRRFYVRPDDLPPFIVG
jgi:hypothetical protein